MFTQTEISLGDDEDEDDDLTLFRLYPLPLVFLRSTIFMTKMRVFFGVENVFLSCKYVLNMGASIHTPARLSLLLGLIKSSSKDPEMHINFK